MALAFRPEQPDWGTPPWRVDLPRLAAPPPSRCDVAVVGAGLAGLAAARALAAGGARVAVLEAGRVGAGASGRTGGIVLEGTHVGELPGLEGCLELLRARVAELEIECGLALPGCRELAHRPAATGLGGGASAAPGWRDGEAVLVEIGREPGGVVDPGRLVAGLARAARAAGATLHEGARVRSAARTPGGRPLLDTTRSAVGADAVLLATNAWLPELMGELAPAPIPALTLALATEPLAPEARDALEGAEGPPFLPFYTADLPYLWGRALDDGGIVAGGGLMVERPGRLAHRSLAEAEAQAGLERLLDRVRGLHGALAGIGVRARWTGPVAILRGRPPFLGRHPRWPRLVVAGGWSGHGVAASVAGGELAARALLDDTPLPDWGAPELRPSSPPGRAGGPGRTRR